MKTLSTKKESITALIKRLRRARSKRSDVEDSVRRIVDDVRRRGDRALIDLTKKFDGVALKRLRVSEAEIRTAYRIESRDVVRALKSARAAIAKFHAQNVKREKAVETQKGVRVWREFRPIENVGLYVPGGKAAYPSTVLMLGVPAKLAGCKEVVLCVPPDRSGKVPSAVLVAADLCGISKIFKVGGAQAIAALAYGTKTIPKVSKIFGPGNQYVTTAKMQVFGEVDIDMPAGPSEVLVLADASANPAWVAADLLSQLEHGEDSQAILVTPDAKFAADVVKNVNEQVKTLSRGAIIGKSLKRSFAVVVKSIDEACRFINEYAPEHLEIVLKKNEAKVLKKIENAGSIFLGPYASEPLGDYATGANHTLPTSGFAKMFSALSVESFGKKMQIQRVSKRGIANLRKTVETLADREGLDAHKRAVGIRFKK
ncbi:histidinol dehydrogenase [Candidatus Kaiserbacteria bacterium RIFCSPHIGHO2_02_FULL_59_21]|uniref:Histidinol dehydrogenase n=2 Tax=Candidatus Kaiseribacteriota TaxID=1752734 RepID=A0A0G1YQ73_9BACT|nr:MAG: Histidinol dehydrogenase [Candidatus Kaiserbacteria bacterium GW2011_GWA2_58_9]OGG62479.1 MAG: histidinol dehydrogenase [Candidatus Kaiserbacteria bacterium RIFCSPHIGHO2_01_FULL_58_22]OGG67535.1 MAG: histidinol dehydrogenase [Candidatus Kaiserbacteria bacterium RIFCSPHIGHO2_02_FULL_59_21]OGG80139.1 MAG: histidinol dehydrogenase [Candidatus Kaiserbacteria bacterium RIFCSPLOWO2_01_FULL_59_34]OGG86930.1 MAG: histidinol dehydrogenase [Candidatus Kaiserbacteria bacterium RIFCSPLOWO2_02_FULL_